MDNDALRLQSEIRNLKSEIVKGDRYTTGSFIPLRNHHNPRSPYFPQQSRARSGHLSNTLTSLPISSCLIQHQSILRYCHRLT
jgi:hypothetical protein